MNTSLGLMSMKPSNKQVSLDRVHLAYHKRYAVTYPDFDLGFFNGNSILFVSDAPLKQSVTRIVSVPNEDTLKAADIDSSTRVLNSSVGHVIKGVAPGQWDTISCTSVHKTQGHEDRPALNSERGEEFEILLNQIKYLQPNLIILLGEITGLRFHVEEYYELRLYDGKSIVMMIPDDLESEKSILRAKLAVMDASEYYALSGLNKIV